MTALAGSSGPTAILAAQYRLQVDLTRKRMTWWIPLIVVAGFGVSILGFLPSVADYRASGSLTPSLFVFAGFSLLFGWGIVMWLIGPLLFRPRIVPYFTRELGPLLGETMAAFRRGRAVYLEIVALDGLAATLGVTPLSAFGFAYDNYGQEVRWHPASEGLRTAEALRRGLTAQLSSKRGVADDLDALIATLRTAVDQRVDFSLVLRLHDSDNIQMVCTREERQGAFW